MPALLQTTKNGICDERKKYSQILKKKSGLVKRMYNVRTCKRPADEHGKRGV